MLIQLLTKGSRLAMIKGGGSMGSHKHGISGIAPKSPKLRHALKRKAEMQSKKRKPSKMYSSMSELMDDR